MECKAEEFRQRDSIIVQKLYDGMPWMCLGLIGGMVFVLFMLPPWVSPRDRDTLISLILVTLILFLWVFVQIGFQKAKSIKTRLKALLPLQIADIRLFDESFEYDKKIVNKLQLTGLCTLPFGLIIAVLQPTLIRFLVSFLIIFIPPLLAVMGYYWYIFLKQKYPSPHLEVKKVLGLRRFLAIKSFSILLIGTIFTVVFLPLYTFINIYSALSESQETVFNNAAKFVRILALISSSPAIVFSCVITFLPLQIIMGNRAFKYYLSLLIVLTLFLSLPFELEIKMVGIMLYLIILNSFVMRNSLPIVKQLKSLGLGLFGIAVGFGLCFLQRLIDILPFSFFGVLFALSIGVLVDIILLSYD